MKHCMPDPEAEKSLNYQFTVYSCVFDNETRARQDEVRLGEDGTIILFPCSSCYEQLKGQILSPIIIEALRARKGKPHGFAGEQVTQLISTIAGIKGYCRPSSLSNEIEGEG